MVRHGACCEGHVTILNELRAAGPAGLLRDLGAALAVTFMAVPQGIAYALIAGLPPITGLYAAAVPTIVGSLFRSSRHVISGPTNAVSLLVGGGVARVSLELGMEPSLVAVQLALIVGLMQAGAGVLRLGSVVDYISRPVVLGYITGAGVLIGVGQLPNMTGTAGGGSDLPSQLWSWFGGLGELTALPLVVGLLSAVAIVGLRRWDTRIPGTLLALGLATVANVVFDLHAMGLRELGDLSSVPVGAPPLTLPGWPSFGLVSLAAAATVLSLVEASAVSRSLADKTGDRVDASREFLGQGLSNLAAAFTGGYPVSGSLARSRLNHEAGAQTRMAGVFSGLLVLGVLLFAGPIVERTPVAALAGSLMVVARDLVDTKRLRMVLHAALGDKVALVATVVGTWVLPLDRAIYLGVAISIALFVRRASLLIVRELRVDPAGRLREVKPGKGASCDLITVLHVEGPLFFGAAAELRQALEEAAHRPALQVLVVRVKRTQGLDATCMDVLANAAKALRERGQTLLLVGMRAPAMERLQATGVADRIGPQNLFPTREGWFVAMDQALDRALELSSPHRPECELSRYLALRRGTALAPDSTNPSEPS